MPRFKLNIAEQNNEAKRICSWDHDKIVNYPNLVKFIKKIIKILLSGFIQIFTSSFMLNIIKRKKQKLQISQALREIIKIIYET